MTETKDTQFDALFNAVLDVMPRHDEDFADHAEWFAKELFDRGVRLGEKKPDTVDAVPVSELLELRDWFYESEGISMGNLGMLNTLIKKYSSVDIPRLENGYERSGEK